jgi:hypothetical protein
MSNEPDHIPAPSISEVILKTSRFDEMKEWYTQALYFEPFFVRPRPEKVSWTESQQIAFFKLRGDTPMPRCSEFLKSTAPKIKLDRSRTPSFPTGA